MRFFTSLKGQLLIPGIMATFAIIFLSFSSSYFINSATKEIENNIEVRTPLTQQASIMRGAINEIIRYTWSIYGMGLDYEERSRLNDLVRNAIVKFEESQKKYESLPKSEKSIQIFSSVPSNWPKLKSETFKVLEALEKNDPRYDDLAKYYINSLVRPTAEILTDSFRELEYNQNIEQKKSSDQILESAKKASTIMPFIGLISLFVTIVSLFIFGTRLSRKLSAITSYLSSGSNKVNHVSTELLGSSKTFKDEIVKQAELIQETTATAEQVGAMISRNAQNATRSVEMADDSRSRANQGQQVISDLIEAITHIKESNEQILDKVQKANMENSQLILAIHEVGNKTKVINEIVFQTKLLSFNASIEAARAGEHGKGFAVVAEEVGNLAQMSGVAAKEISELLLASTKKAEQVAEDMKSQIDDVIKYGQEKIDQGTQVANNAKDTFTEIISSVNQVTDIVKEISMASEEQAKGVAEIIRVITQFDKIARNNEEVSNSTLNISENLLEQGDQLENMVQDLHAILQGIRSNSSSSHSAAKPLHRNAA